MYQYKAKVVRVIDGDTFKVSVDVGFNIIVEITLRLRGINTPEIWGSINEAEREHGGRAARFVKDLIEGKEVTIITHKLDIYYRYDAEVFTSNGRNLANILEEEGFAKLDSYKEETNEEKV